MALPADWTPGRILPPGETRAIPVSIRMPRDLYQELGRYAKRVGAKRTYLILECLRRLLAANANRQPKTSTRSKSLRRNGRPRARQARKR